MRGMFASGMVLLASLTPLAAAPVPPPSKGERSRAIAELITLHVLVQTRHSSVHFPWRPDQARARGDTEAIAAMRGEGPVIGMSLWQCKAPRRAFRLLRYFPELERLSAHSRLITDEEAKALAELHNLRKLDLLSTGLTDAGLRYLEGLHDLRELALSGKKITDTGIHCLRNLTKLESLALTGHGGLSDAGAPDLACLTRLESLWVTGPITNKGLTQLCRLKRLRKLILWRTGITDAGLAQLKTLPKLEELQLPGTPIGDAGVAQLKALAHLRELNLAGTQVTDAGLKSLYPMSTLKTVTLGGGGVTVAGVRALHAARPDIRIVGFRVPDQSPKAAPGEAPPTRRAP
ncbi:MAG TPA: hypothetical protein VFA18_20500 [Gemmataceae bacterium]|nr:hypothetical protein [Gemmataceae bacterium]